MIDKSTAKKNLLQWVTEKASKEISIDTDTALLKEKIISSVQLMDLIIYIEHLTEKPISVDKIKPESFSSIDSIYLNFFSEKNSVETA